MRADGVADVVVLDRSETPYNESYFQYTFPITCKLSKYPGEVCTWIQIYSGTPSNPVIAKTGECMLQVQESKNMDDYLCDHQMTALYQLTHTMNCLLYTSQRWNTVRPERKGGAVGNGTQRASPDYL